VSQFGRTEALISIHKAAVVGKGAWVSQTATTHSSKLLLWNRHQRMLPPAVDRIGTAQQIDVEMWRRSRGYWTFIRALLHRSPSTALHFKWMSAVPRALVELLL
jgi:hypothetical protein